MRPSSINDDASKVRRMGVPAREQGHFTTVHERVPETDLLGRDANEDRIGR